MKRHAGMVVSFLIGALFMAFCVLYQDPASVYGYREWMRILSNAALLPGVLFAGIGAMIKISEQGFFDGIHFAFSSFISHMRRESKHYASYYDYQQREKKKGNTGTLLVTGMFFLLLAVILAVIYYI